MIKKEIRPIDYGLAFTVFKGNKPLYIEINKNLKKYPKLRKKILAHELLHWKAKSSWENFKIDFFEMFNFRKQFEINKFCIENLKAYLCNSPVFFENGKLIFNYFMLGLWIVISISLISLGLIL